MSETSAVRIGAHVDQTDPIAEAKARNAPLVQFFLGNPQGYKGPVLAYEGGAERLRARRRGGRRRPLRPRALPRQRRDHEQPPADPEPQAAPAAHRRRRRDRRQGPDRPRRPRHRTTTTRAKGFDNWRKAVEATDLKIPLLIENTAGGNNAMTRYLERIAGVWDGDRRHRGRRPGRLLPRHLPRPRRRQPARDRRRGRPQDHRPDRPRPLQRQPRRLRLRRRPARQLRRRADRPRPARRGRARRRRTGRLRDARRRRRAPRRLRLAPRAGLVRLPSKGSLGGLPAEVGRDPLQRLRAAGRTRPPTGRERRPWISPSIFSSSWSTRASPRS